MMKQRRQTTHRAAFIFLAGCAASSLVAVGCGSEIEVPNSPGSILAAGDIEPPVEGCDLTEPTSPDAGSTTDAGSTADAGDAGADAGAPVQSSQAIIERVDDALSIPYLARDREADDLQVSVEICLWDGQQATDCGVAVVAPGGDTTDRVPTAPAGTCVLHVFHWNVGCGRFVGANNGGASPQQASIDDVNASLVARVSVVGSDEAPSQTEPFTLKDVGFDAVPTCD